MKKICITILLNCMLLISACSSEETNQNIESISINSEVKKVISETYVNEIRYTKSEIIQILDSAKKYDIQNPFIPTKGVNGEYVMNIREEDHSMAIIYPHFGIRQSKTNFIQKNENEIEKTVQLRGGNEAVWIYHNDWPRLLYIKMDDVYVTISTAKSYDSDDFEIFLDSLE